VTQKWSLAGLSIGLGLIILAAIIGYDVMHMRVPPVHAKVGPRVFPVIVSCGLALAGLLSVLAARRGGFQEAEGDTDWRAVAFIAVGLVAQLNLLKPLGFVPAGFILFMSVVFGFGSQKYLRDSVIALAVVTITYFVFTRFLGLQLPSGILAGLI
jgi:putative tricarboxylic transport membrane protein